MRARIPQDVDLEDKLIYGLTPIHFGYLVVGVLACMAVWDLYAVPLAARLPACAALSGAGIALAWGRWRGRALDRLVLDWLLFLRRNYHLELADPAGADRRKGAAPWRERAGPSPHIELDWINRLAEAPGGP